MKDLYFIPILLDAFDQTSREPALREAFARIKELGQRPEYVRGYRQFQHFMEHVAGAHDSSQQTEDNLINRAIQFCAELPANHDALTAAMETDFGDDPSLRDAVAAIVEQFSARQQPDDEIGLTVFHDNQPVANFRLSPDHSHEATNGVGPGQYRVELVNGRVLCEFALTSRDIQWSLAFPSKPLSAAADTGASQRPRTLHRRFANGEIELSVYPGVEDAELVLSLGGPA